MHPDYRRILALVSLDRVGLAVARAAAGEVRHAGARLALGHVVDWATEWGCDDFSVLTPQELEQRLKVVVSRQITALAGRIGIPDAASLVAFGGPERGLGELARSWQPDLVVVDNARFGDLAAGGVVRLQGWECDALAVETGGIGSRRLRDLARMAWLSPLPHWPR
ncbi:universal stress protein [Magnetospirillum sp. UT-4]|uniref:universal stress protein n=1 Tax=Magnetospirillum sp. UT-4 TaxID=2681467 RepID=UPI0013809B2A|nr:universal stress protein [Magnetospirillum sp. UT-4]CAA7623769.1 putative Universal stress protein [Magnetospirillum sp. UT-4]